METAKLKKSQVTKELYDSILPEYRDIFFSKEENYINAKPRDVEITDSFLYPKVKTMIEEDEEEKKMYEQATINTEKALRILVASLSKLNQIRCSSEEIKNKLENEALAFRGPLQLDNIIFHLKRNNRFEAIYSNYFSFIVNICSSRSNYTLHIQIDMDITNPKLEVSRIFTRDDLYSLAGNLTAYDIRTMRKVPYLVIESLNRILGKSSNPARGFNFI